MSLRTKLLGLFTLLAAGPLLAIGLIGYALTERSVSAQLEGQTRALADRSAEEISHRIRLIESDLRLMGENAESERLLGLRAEGASAEEALAAQLEAERFLDAAWAVLGASYAEVELRDAAGATLLRRGGAAPEDPVEGRLLQHTIPVHSWDDPDRQLGTVQALVYDHGILPVDALEARFGRLGISAVVHRPTGRVLYYSDGEGRTVRRLVEAGLSAAALEDRQKEGALRLDARGEDTDAAATRIGWLALIESPPLAVLALADRAEFAAPFDRQRTVQLALVLLLGGTVLSAGWLLLRRMTHSLDELTTAADRVGRGDFAPELPPAGDDEVGRLAAAFRSMTQEIRRMVLEIERSRQLAAVGEFAAELSHEIRNPLTALKLNLQRLERMLLRHGAPAEAERPLQIALSEVARLDRVVSSTLRLGRPDVPAAERRRIAVRELVEAAVAPLREQLEAQRIELVLSCPDADVAADAEHMTGALLNVLLNAVEAMPDGGVLRITASVDGGSGSVEIRVADTGGGIPVAALERLFRPFSTTKPDGTGLGLALAHRTIEAHGGSLALAQTGPEGTSFRIRLPLAGEMVRA
jgi:signal transduction histidine kinase